MKSLSIDLETYSGTDIGKSGVYRYSEDPDFQILLFGCSIDDGPVKVYDLARGETLPPEILQALTDDSVIKWAFNAQFERICLSRYLYPGEERFLSPKGWHCTRVWVATLGLPLSLEGAGYVLGLEKQKMKEGKELIRYFCCPCKPTRANQERTRNRPEDAPEKWEIFKAYNKRDVETEMAIQERLHKYPVPESEWENYVVDQVINDTGIAIDLALADEAIKLDAEVKESTLGKMKEITQCENPNSVMQLKAWLEEKGIQVESLGKGVIEDLKVHAPPEVKEVLSLRQLIAKSSVKKYDAMKNVVCKDGRARGLIQFYGAVRTGRYAGRLIQVQNLPQNHMKDLPEARALVRSGDWDTLHLLYDNLPGVLSELIRTAFIPKVGSRFIVADFSAIEARVIAWLSGESWRMKVFAEGGDIYCASASAMFHVPVKKNGINGHLRQKGKIAELALGYGGSVGALKAMGATKMGIPEEELQDIVDAWRKASPHITDFWWSVDKAAKAAIRTRSFARTHCITFGYQGGMLFIKLLSGRKLAYVKPMLLENQYGSEAITYEGLNGAKKWDRLESYGPKLVENIVQATARDILAGVMKRLTEKGFRICMHIHDEVVVEVPEGKSSVKEICDLMGITPPWAEGLKLRADGYECPFYQKD